VNLKSLFTLILKMLLAAALIAWLLHEGALDLNQVVSVLTPVRVGIILLFCFFLIYFNAIRWRLLLSVRGLRLPLKEVLPLSLIAVFFNLAMPGGMGGDVVKGYYLVKDYPDERTSTIISIVIDRLLGIFILALTASLAVIFRWSDIAGNKALETIAWIVFLSTIVFSAVFLAMLSRRVRDLAFTSWIFKALPMGQKLENAYLHVQSYRNYPRALLSAALLSVVSQTFQIMIFIAMALWLGVTELSLADYLFLVPVGLVLTSIPISPAGVGVGQVAFYYLFNLALGKTSPVGPATVTAFQLSQVAWGLVGAVLYIQRPEIKTEN
jgi:glycosyltransferase 2 family protein